MKFVLVTVALAATVPAEMCVILMKMLDVEMPPARDAELSSKSRLSFQRISSKRGLEGQTISMDRAHVAIQGVPGLASQESREVTYGKGKRLIEEVASQLRINKHCVDTAFNFFKMCVTRNLTRGRLRSHVVAACLYMTCRLENTSHLLLDFSDVTQVNVYDLGRTLNFLSRSLRINLPTTDPCLYVLRFAVLLDFGDKQKEVGGDTGDSSCSTDEERLAGNWQETHWIAALLLAARSYNFNRSVTDVVRVVHVSEAVVRKRLDEFSQTPSSALTLDQFSSVDLEHSEDPPAYREARRRAIVAREEEEAERMERDMMPIQEEVERALEKKQREKFKKSPFARMVGGSIEGGEEMGRAETALITDDILDSVYREASSNTVEDVYRESVVGPSLESLGILRGAVAAPPSVFYALPAQDGENGDLFTEDIDDDEIDSYILTDQEAHIESTSLPKTTFARLKPQNIEFLQMGPLMEKTVDRGSGVNGEGKRDQKKMGDAPEKEGAFTPQAAAGSSVSRQGPRAIRYRILGRGTVGLRRDIGRLNGEPAHPSERLVDHPYGQSLWVSGDESYASIPSSPQDAPLPTEIPEICTEMGERSPPTSPHTEESELGTDKHLPLWEVARVMRTVVPECARISEGSMKVVQESASEFIAFVTRTASELVEKEGRSKITADDLIRAMEVKGFHDYIPVLKRYMARRAESRFEEWNGKVAMVGAESPNPATPAPARVASFDYSSVPGWNESTNDEYAYYKSTDVLSESAFKRKLRKKKEKDDNNKRMKIGREVQDESMKMDGGEVMLADQVGELQEGDAVEEPEESGEGEVLYCLCKTPYDDSKFYVGCDACEGWYHPKCVSITQEEAETVAEYICPLCLGGEKKEEEGEEGSSQTAAETV